MNLNHLSELAKLALIFGFVIALVAIKSWRLVRQQKLWHDTVRLALEKGQPLPDQAGGDLCAADWWQRGWRRRPWSDVRAGLIMVAVGLGLYYAIPGSGRVWGYLPAFIGFALLIAGLLGLLRSDKNPDQKDPSGQM